MASQSENIEKEMRALVAEILEIQEDKIKPDMKFVEELGMDSMMALEILAGIEKNIVLLFPRRPCQNSPPLIKR